MPCTLNKEAWEKLVDEDIEWLDKQPNTLECKHIRQILEWVKTHKPDREAERIKELDRLRAGVRVSLIAARSAVIKGGEVTEEMLTELIDELEVKP